MSVLIASNAIRTLAMERMDTLNAILLRSRNTLKSKKKFRIPTFALSTLNSRAHISETLAGVSIAHEPNLVQWI